MENWYANSNVFFEMRKALFQELPEDVIVEIAKIHEVASERVLKYSNDFEDEENLVEETAQPKKSQSSRNIQRLKALSESIVSCCSNECFQRFDKTALNDFARALDGCSKGEVEAAFLMNLLEHEGKIEETRRGKPRQRQRVNYSVPPFGVMCREAFLLLWGIGERSLRNYREYHKAYPGSFAPRVHGNANKTSNYVLSSTIWQKVVNFIIKIGKEAGEESQGRNLKRNNQAVEKEIVRFLPAYYSVSLLYRLFVADYQEKEKLEPNTPPPLSLRQFYNIFQSPECASVQLRSPRNDVCDVCLLYRNQIRRDTGIVDEYDEEEVFAWNDHVTRAKEARNVYKAELEAAHKGYTDMLTNRNNALDYVPHATFDFAQDLGLPQLSNQPQELYFSSQRSIRVFSVKDDGSGIQYNFLYDEGNGGKGSNYVGSMLVLFLLDLGRQFNIRRVLLNADNCGAQNKNNTVLWILELLVMLDIFEHIELKFLVKGHTHCSVDGGHGLIKKAWRKQNVFSIQQAKKVIEESAHTQRAMILSPKEFFDWSSLLSRYFRKFPGISSQQEFEFDKNRFGRIRYRRRHSQKWQSYRLFKRKDLTLPEELSSIEGIKKHLQFMEPPGIPLKKQWNLFKKLRKYVPEELKEELCPKPKGKEPTNEMEEY